MPRPPRITIADPAAVRVGRASTEDGRDFIVTTYEFELDGETEEARIAVRPDAFISFIVASLNALGFPESDTEYIAQRYDRENP
jgi:hypothetical protein